MSSDLFNREVGERIATLSPIQTVEAGAWDGFARGTGMTAMRALARTGRAVDLLGAMGPMAQDAISGGTEAQDRYFKEHDEVFGSAVDYWTPKPGEVGIAGQVTGELLTMLPMVIASPSLAVASLQLGEGEELVRQGVPASKAQAVGAIQAAGLGLGIWVPILGRTLTQRMLVGGAGFNVFQGVTTRAASELVLEGTPQAEMYKALDPTYLTLDTLLGLGFGGISHLSPSARAQGGEALERVAAWAQNLKPSEIDALAAMRQAQHMSADSMPGKPVEPKDAEFHVERIRQAIEQAVRDEPINVQDLPEPTFQADQVRNEEAASRVEEMALEAERIRVEEDIPQPPEPEPAAPPRLVPENMTLLPPEQQARALGQAVENRLLELKVNENEAKANAALWEAFFQTTSHKYGIPVVDIVKAYGIDVRRMSRSEVMLDALQQSEGPPVARAGEPGYVSPRGQDQTGGPGRATAAAEEPENLRATVAGGSPAQGWARATRASRKGRPLPVYRGAADPLRPEHFGPDSLGRASGNPSSGLGVWFTPSKTEAATYGKAEEAYLDIRNPKVVKIEDLQGFETVADATKWREQLRAQGHDSIIVTAKHLGGKTHLVAFDPQQVIPSAPTAPVPGETLFQAAARSKILQTKAFKDWFGDSKVVDAEGKPLVVYHGTNADFDTFKILGGGAWFTSDPEFADSYSSWRGASAPEGKSGSNVMPVYLSIQKPATAVDVSKAWAAVIETVPPDQRAGQVMKNLIAKGFDGLVSGNLFRAFKPDQIKSAIGNRGTFDPTDPNVLFQSKAVQSRWYSELERQITAANMKAAPAKGWKDYLKSLASKGVKTDELKWSGIEEWLDLQGGRVTKDQVLEFLKENGVKVEEVVLGNTAASTRADEENQALVADLESLGFRVETEPDAHTNEIVLSGVEDLRPGAGGHSYGFTPGEGFDFPEGMTVPVPPEVVAIGRRLAELEHEVPNIEGTTAKFAQYQLPGGTDYREFLFIAPSRPEDQLPKGWKIEVPKQENAEGQYTLVGPDGSGQILRGARTTEEAMDQAMNLLDNQGVLDRDTFRESHWVQKNVIAHVRANERTNAEGKRGLMLEELQADWAQKLRRRILALEEAKKSGDQAAIANAQRNLDNFPKAPFIDKTEAWVGLILKRMIREAAERGLDFVAWTTGEQQTGRYTSALRKAVDKIEWKKTPEGVQLVGYKGLSKKVVDTTEKEDVLSDAIGKTMADRIRNDPNQEGTIEGEGIAVADTGMASFYDRIVPNVAKEVLKKLGGGKVGKTKIELKTVGTTENLPAFEGMTPDAMDLYQGAENFPNGGPPGYAEVRVMVDGQEGPAAVIIDRQGVTMAVELTDEPAEFFVSWENMSRPDGAGARAGAPDDAREALARVHRAWRNLQSALWLNMTTRSGEAVAIQPVTASTATSEQQSIEITPELRERALSGMPLFQGGERGAIRIGPETVIGLFENTDASTFLHESGHLFLQITRDMAGRGAASLDAMSDWAALARWLKIEGGEITREQHEKFATTFERYLADGKAPTEELRSVFQQFRDWLLQIYKSLASIADDIPDEIKGVLDRMLTSQRADPTPKAEGPPPAESEPPPPPGEGAATGRPEAQPFMTEEELAEGRPQWEPRGLEDLQIREAVAMMAEVELGWEQIGGRRANLSISTTSGQPNFTKWIPKSELWPGRPDKAMNEGRTREAVRKALAGEKLKAAEQRMIDYMLEIANERMAAVERVGGSEEWNSMAMDLAGAELEPNTQNVLDADLVARAAAKDEIRLERAALKYDNDDAAFMAEVRKILGKDIQNQAARPGGEEGEGAPGGERAGERQAGEAEDPVAAAAEEYVASNPEQMLMVGEAADGTPIQKTVRQYLEDELLDAAEAREDTELVRAAVKCLLGRA